MAQPTNLLEATIRDFSDLDVATEFVAGLRWPDGFVCPHCGGRDYSYVSTRRLWKCKSCRRQSSVKVGTIFEGSALGLDKWLPAIWLVANAETAISSHELARAIGTTQKSAWLMLRRIAEAEATWNAPPADVEATAVGTADAPLVPNTRPGVLVAVAAVFFALGALCGWLAARWDRLR
jgi:transposase-like protein